jgi:hypothetical protein
MSCASRIYDKDLNKMAKLVKAQLQGVSLEQTNILRWEDDGGQAIESREAADRLDREPDSRNKQPIALPSIEELG